MKAWATDSSTRPGNRVGNRYLIATTEDLSLVACGYTRPYNAQDAEYWAYTFENHTGPRGNPHRDDGNGPTSGEPVDEAPFLLPPGEYSTPVPEPAAEG